MNILIDELPDEVGGIPVYTSFRNMVLFEQALSDPEASPQEQLFIAIGLLYKKPIPDLQRAVDGLLWFYRCGAPEEHGAGGGGRHDRAYDFEVDAPDIFAAFWQAYGIDLNACGMHWWKFRALMNGLPEECKIVKIMGYRTMDLSKFKGEEKKQYAKLKRQFKLKPLKTEALPLAAQEASAREHVKKRFEAAEKWKQKQSMID